MTSLKRNCPACGQPNPPNARFCIRCGQPLAEPPRLSARETPEAADGNVVVPQSDQKAIVIGRDPRLSQRGGYFLNHPALSFHHARIERRGSGWFVVDLNSEKGTFVDYTAVPPGPEGLPIGPDSVVWIAPYAFRVRSRGDRSPLEQAHMQLDAVDLKRTVPGGRRGESITILDTRGVPLSFRPGEFIALVGGSGTGKTTLMKAINGLAPAQEGQVLIDGSPIIDAGNARQFAALYSIIGYVPQDDVMYRDLTANEVLTYTARLRLASLKRDEMNRVIEQTLVAVELSEHAHKRVVQLSGGQRKRVNIAMELIAQPRLLFLDEPTSGLDPGLDLEVMMLLRRWARGQVVAGDGGQTSAADPKTIILVTHATENIELCDYIAFMATGGQLAYFGPPAEAKQFFCPSRPAETVTYSEIYRLVASTPADAETGAVTWPERFRQSDFFQRYVISRAPAAVSDTKIAPAAGAEPPTPWSRRFSGQRLRSAMGQLRILVGRYSRLVSRDRLNAGMLLFQAPLTAMLLGAVSSPNALRPAGALDAEKVLFILACAATWLGIINGTKEIVKEQDIYQRERLYGLGAVPYVLSKISVLGIIALLQTVLLVLFVALQFELPAGGVFLPLSAEMFITLSLSMIAGLSLGLLISAYARTSDLATSLMFLALIVQIIFSGLLFDASGLAQIPSLLTTSRWGLEALGASANLNSLLVSAIPGYDWDAGYASSGPNLVIHWFILVTFSAVLIALTCRRQARK